VSQKNIEDDTIKQIADPYRHYGLVCLFFSHECGSIQNVSSEIAKLCLIE
jgi:ABC-type dipeptide/oligopeptide/nickel transport system ATPase subunit